MSQNTLMRSLITLFTLLTILTLVSLPVMAQTTAAGGGRKPVNHPGGKYGPHYHPSDKKGKPLNHDHYYYPNRRG